MIISYEDLEGLRKKYSNKKIVFCSGTFDLTHAGHIIFFEDCKKFGNILVVAMGDDKLIKYYKGKNRPILNEHIRLKNVDSLRVVDYCLLDSPFETGESSLLVSLSTIFKKLKPNVYVVNEDAKDIEKRKEISDRYNVELKILKRWCPKEFEKISTSKIIDKIIGQKA